MASAPSNIFVLLLLFLLLYSYDSKVHGDVQGFEVLREGTLMPATACSPWKAPSENSLKLTHRHGPCFPSDEGQPDHLQILSQDSLRAAYLQAEIPPANASGNTSVDASPLGSPASLRTLSGFPIGSNGYVVTVGIGSPARNQTVIFDTGSNICWVQCRLCRSCYKQQEPLFDPSASSSYHRVPCNDPACTSLHSEQPNCSGSTCIYRVVYGDSSSTTGPLARERLTLTSAAVIRNFVFGCGQDNRGLKGVAGLFGLGRNFHSLVSQAYKSLGNNNVFSYCLPSSNGNAGHLTIGNIMARSPSYMPMLPSRPNNPGLYFVDLVGISVGRQMLRVSPLVFKRFGTIIDSGTMVSRLPPAAYTELRNVFRSMMSQYRLIAPIGILDTCYDFKNVRNVSFPTITLHFPGSSSPLVNLVLTQHQVFYVVNTSQTCLAFAPTGVIDTGIIGAIQQRATDVIYDIGAQKIGFAAGQCS